MKKRRASLPLLLAVTIIGGSAPLLLTATTAAAGGTPLALELVPYATGFSSPVSIANSGVTGDERIFVVEQAGTIRVVQAGGAAISTFLDIESRVDDSASEEGLLGLAFHPDYATNGTFFVNYTFTQGTRYTRISRFSVTADPNVADPFSEDVLLTVVQPDWNHNAGDIHFGPDGYLYVPLGDGGGAGDTGNNAQNLTRLLGKIIRIDVDSGPGSPPDCLGIGSGNYTVPDDNPFIDGAGGVCDEMWAVGLRNPWRSSFDRVTGDFWIGDVGQGAREEIDFQPATSPGGENYGWRCYEGGIPFNTNGCGPIGDYTLPIHEYPQSGTGGCSVIGGYVYRGSQFQAMYGSYLYTDYCHGDFFSIEPSGLGGWLVTEQLSNQGFGFVAFGEDVAGEMYVAKITNGIVYHIRDNSATTGLDDQPLPPMMPAVEVISSSYRQDITISLPRDGQTTVRIVDANGRTVATMVDGYRTAGHHRLTWDGRNQRGRTVAAGVYFIELQSGGTRAAAKFVMVR